MLLVGCATAPQPSEEAEDLAISHQDPEVEAQLLRLEAAQILAQEGNYQQSLELVQSIQLHLLPAEERWRLLVLAAENALALDDGRQALRQINRISQSLEQTSLEQEYQLAGYRSAAFEITGHFVAALQQSYSQTLIAPNLEKQEEAQNRLWQQLNQLSGEQLNNLVSRERQAGLRGWIELAQVRQQTTENFEAFQSLMDNWTERWPNHPARQNLPEDLELLAELSRRQVQHLGVFLPSSGPLAEAAQAIRNALIARHIRAGEEGQFQPQISFYDTQSGSLDELYQQAKRDQVEVIIGPLAKSRVDLLERRSNLPLPTLALNYGNDPEFPNRDLFQFGLSAENEARQVAQKAWQSGFRRALSLTPEGDWGTRVEASFIKAWEELGGEITHTRQYGEGRSLDSALRQLLEVQLSQQRHQNLTRLLGQRPHFVARPREDSDFLFLHANTATGRQVKPALSFLLASGLPVMATSSIYSGTPNPSQDRDMNEIAFADITWYLAPEDELQKRIREAWPSSMNRYGRLYAMGVDAYLLAQRMELLEALPESRLDGATGRLGHQHRRIERELQWAQFIAGRPQPLPENAFEQQQLVDQLILD
ncbi:penicillin-binding protein activator [Marinospirillum celere]|nr:penicillin-binding protein activator [Marinospirillum celere]